MKLTNNAALISISSALRISPVIILLLISQYSFSQVSFASRSSQSEIKVKGTSNLHDWTMKGNTLTCDAQFTVQSAAVNKLLSLNGLSFSVPVKNLKSGESLLDSRAYKAMKADKYSQVSFKMSSAVVTPLNNNQYQIKATGQLSISGVTKEVTLLANGTINTDRSMNISGSKTIKMSDFGIKPPSFMLGALKTGDEVTIDFNLKFKGN